MVALLELGTVTSIPQSHNYHHLAWVSDLEQGAVSLGCLLLPADRLLVIASRVHNNNLMMIIVIYWTLAADPARG